MNIWEAITKGLMRTPLASTVFLAYAIVGAVMLLAGTLDYGGYSNNLLAVGIACGAIGIPRAVSKIANGLESFNLLGLIESIPIPSVVFVVFVTASSVDLALTHITIGIFSENVLKVGIACGAVQSARAVEHVFAPSEV
jgi:acyl CoA:acetate/3-ketoacid CoA transferase alpha subunit